MQFEYGVWYANYLTMLRFKKSMARTKLEYVRRWPEHRQASREVNALKPRNRVAMAKRRAGGNSNAA